MGFLIGAIIGYKAGGYFGLILCGILGAVIEQRINGPKKVRGKRAIQEAYFNALFLCMGRLAKLDGHVSNEEIQKAEGIMRHMQLSTELRQHAIDLFNQGKRGGDIEQALRVFGQLSRQSLSLRQIFLEMLVDVAEADGNITQEETTFLESVCRLIGYPVHMFVAMARMRGMGAGFDPFSGRQRSQHHQRQKQQRQQRHRRNRSTSAPINPYAVLGVNANDNKATIRRAYKKMMSQHHPDKLVAKGLPPEMMKVAEEKAKQVQQAWEEIKDRKGW